MREKLETFLIYGPMVAVILLILEVCAFGQTPTPVPAPKGPHQNGYWQVQPGIYVPCNAIKPFQPFVNTPGDGQTYYLGGDVNANVPHPNNYGLYIDAIYYNHSHAYYDAQGFITPMRCGAAPGELCPPNSYPAPSSAANLCSQWTASGNSSACPGGSPAWYTNAFMTNSVGVWQNSYAFYKPQIDADCSGPQPTATPAPPTKTPTPSGPTPTPAANQFAKYIEWASQQGITAGCGGGNFCPGNPVNRDAMTAFLFNLAKWVQTHPGQVPVLPPCATPQAFGDVRCQ